MGSRPEFVNFLGLLILILGWGGNVAADDYSGNSKIWDVLW